MELGESTKVNIGCYLKALEGIEPEQRDKVKQVLDNYNISGVVTVYRGEERDGEIIVPYRSSNTRGYLRFDDKGYYHKGLEGWSGDNELSAIATTTLVLAAFGKDECSEYDGGSCFYEDPLLVYAVKNCGLPVPGSKEEKALISKKFKAHNIAWNTIDKIVKKARENESFYDEFTGKIVSDISELTDVLKDARRERTMPSDLEGAFALERDTAELLQNVAWSDVGAKAAANLFQKGCAVYTEPESENSECENGMIMVTTQCSLPPYSLDVSFSTSFCEPKETTPEDKWGVRDPYK